MHNYQQSKFYFELCDPMRVRERLGQVYFKLEEWAKAYDFLETGESKGDCCVRLGYLDLAV